MLEELRITGLGVIQDAVLPLSGGLTVITGETGAGKTMVVAGLGLLLGGRADAGRVRSDARRAVVEGRLRLSGPVAKVISDRVQEAGAECDEDGSLLLSRSVTAEGRSRAHVGGRSVPVAVLGELGEQIVALHGQSDQLRLLRPAEQRGALDRYAGAKHERILVEYREAFEAWRKANEELREKRASSRERHQEADLLRLGLTEISTVAPSSGEEQGLLIEVSRLEHAEGLRSAAVAAQGFLAGAEEDMEAQDAAMLLGEARRALESQESVDPKLAELAERLAEAHTLLADVSSELTVYLSTLEADPNRLAAIHERRNELRMLTRKYAEDIDGVLAWAKRAERRLAELDVSDETLAALTQERDRHAERAADLAARLSLARKEAAGRFAREVTAELVRLAMPHARIEVSVRDRPAGGRDSALMVAGKSLGATSDGVDEVELRLVAHSGASALPLQRGASGGELSRVMLAVEVVFAGVGGPPTLVFDEVDAGVGGRAAVEIGRCLARLALKYQVLVVTHLPQVAAFADQHLLVAKGTEGTVTTSGIRSVRDGERARELARMLAGLPDSDLGVAHASELLTLAATEKAALR